LIVGGSGLSVALAILEWYEINQLDKDNVSLKIFWGVRELYNSVLLDSLDKVAQHLNNLSITVCYDACLDLVVQKDRKYLQFFEGNPADAAMDDDALIINEN